MESGTPSIQIERVAVPLHTGGMAEGTLRASSRGWYRNRRLPKPRHSAFPKRGGANRSARSTTYCGAPKAVAGSALVRTISGLGHPRHRRFSKPHRGHRSLGWAYERRYPTSEFVWRLVNCAGPLTADEPSSRTRLRCWSFGRRRARLDRHPRPYPPTGCRKQLGRCG